MGTMERIGRRGGTGAGSEDSAGAQGWIVETVTGVD